MCELIKILTNGNILKVDGCDCSLVEIKSVNKQKNEKIVLANNGTKLVLCECVNESDISRFISSS